MVISDSLEKMGYFEFFKERARLSKYSPIFETGFNYKFNIHLVINTAEIQLNVLQASYHVNDQSIFARFPSVHESAADRTFHVLVRSVSLCFIFKVQGSFISHYLHKVNIERKV